MRIIGPREVCLVYLKEKNNYLEKNERLHISLKRIYHTLFCKHCAKLLCIIWFISYDNPYMCSDALSNKSWDLKSFKNLLKYYYHATLKGHKWLNTSPRVAGHFCFSFFFEMICKQWLLYNPLFQDCIAPLVLFLFQFTREELLRFCLWQCVHYYTPGGPSLVKWWK